VRDPIREGKELYKAGSLHGEWPANELLARVEAIRAYGESIPVKRKRMVLLLIGGIVAVIVFAILCSWLDSALVATICFVGVCAGIIAFVAAIVMLIRGPRRCDQDAAAVLGPLALCIGPDLAKGSLLKVSASLKAPTAPDLLVETGKKYSTANYQECIDRFFKREILNLECRLSDGTRLLADIAEHTVEKILKKKNPRGKWKTKKKYRRRIGFRVRLQLDESRCRLTGEFKLPVDTSVRVRKHPRGPSIFLSLKKYVTEKQHLDAGPLLAVLAGAYNAVTPMQQSKLIPPGGKQ